MRGFGSAVLAVCLLAAACGDEAPAAPGGTRSFPVAVRGVEIPASPERIVSLSATHTEILYALGVGERLVATDLFSDFPSGAANTPKVDAFNLNVEAVAAFDPDLVVLAFDPGDAASGLGALGIPTLVFAAPGPASLEEVYAEIRDLGLAAGASGEADSLVDRMDSEISAVLDAVPVGAASTYFLELDSTLFTPGPGTLLDALFGMAGLVSIADPAQGAFQQLSAEHVLAADPDFIFLADTVCCGESAETVAARPGWSSLSAVAGGRVVELDDSVVSRWGPRLVDLVRRVVAEVYG